MLQNYKILENGIIKQIKINKKIEYDQNYIKNSYDNYGEKVNYISYLRLGYLIGSLGFVPKSILDVGYGNGIFLKNAKNIIPNCYGNDITDYNLPDNIIFIKNIFSQHFDVITFFDSLEHFDDIEFIKKLNCDYILISLPWCTYKSDEWFEKWKHRRPDEHLFHFNDLSLIKFMEECGYNLINITNIEDTIRKSTEEKNILTGIFKKNDIR
jgi:hypothetical protein